jgi:hypothetical protein
MAGFNSGKEQRNEIRLIGHLRNGGKTGISAKLFVLLASPTGFESRQGQLSGDKEARASRDTAETTFDHDVHH